MYGIFLDEVYSIQTVQNSVRTLGPKRCSFFQFCDVAQVAISWNHILSQIW